MENSNLCAQCASDQVRLSSKHNNVQWSRLCDESGEKIEIEQGNV